MPKELGLWLIIGGVILISVGILIYSGSLRWFGKLPGDFHYEGEHTHIYFPLTTMILLSVILTFTFYLIRKFF